MKIKDPETEHKGSLWTHPYVAYIALTTILFGGLVTAAYLAIKNNWLPTH